MEENITHEKENEDITHEKENEDITHKKKNEDITHKKKNEHTKIKRNLTNEMRKNPWILSTLVLGVVTLILLVGNFGGAISNSVPEGDAGQIVLDFANSQVEGAELIGVEEESGLYKVTLSLDGRDVPVYLTLDGENLISGLTPLSLLNEQTENTPNTQTEVPKSDKPVVELFIMSYCPYGTQAEKGILPVVSLLGDKIDFKLRAVHYILHGEKEDIENKRELCIREEQGQDKLNKYLVCILDSDNPNEPGDVIACEAEAGINSVNLQTCLDTKADDYFAADSVLSQGYDVKGSPTLIINGVQSSAGRSPASYLAGICDAFNIAPAECSEALSSASPSAGFGYNEGTDTVAQC